MNKFHHCREAQDQKIKVLFLYVSLIYGGAEIGLFRTLKTMDKNRFECSVVSIEKKGPLGEQIEKLGVRVIYLNSAARLFNLFLIFRIAGLLAREKPDILDCCLFYANFFGRAASFFFRPKVVIAEEHCVYNEKRFYHIILDKLLSHFTDRIIACSNSVIDFTSGQEGIKKEKFNLLYNAVDAERFDIAKSKEELREEYSFKREDFIIGTVGTIIPRKGHKYIIEAASQIQEVVARLKILIIGDGPGRRELEDFVRLRGVEDKVIFMGARADIPNLMKMMDIFAFPSLQEGFPIAILEAMYLGLPVIASNISGIPEVISDGKDGFLIEPENSQALGEKITVLYEDKDLRGEIGFNARRRICSDFLPVHYITRLQKLYLEELDNKLKN